MKSTFAVNLYDNDGDCYLKGVFIFLEGTKTILHFKDSNEIEEFAKSLLHMLPELRENEARKQNDKV